MAWPSDALILLPQPLRIGRRGERTVPNRRGGADSQRVKTIEAGGPPAYDAAKKVNGRKRHALVDTQGRGSLLRVSSADVLDHDGAVPLLRTSHGRFPVPLIQDPLPGMKLGVAVTTVTGLALLIALLVYNDAAAVLAAVGQVGWGLAGVILVRAAILVLAGFGWERLVAAFVSVAPHPPTCGSAGFVNPLSRKLIS